MQRRIAEGIAAVGIGSGFEQHRQDAQGGGGGRHGGEHRHMEWRGASFVLNIESRIEPEQQRDDARIVTGARLVQGRFAQRVLVAYRYTARRSPLYHFGSPAKVDSLAWRCDRGGMMTSRVLCVEGWRAGFEQSLTEPSMA